MGRRTSAWMPLIQARPAVRVYLSSRCTDSSAARCAGVRGAFMSTPFVRGVRTSHALKPL
ncbi:Uncharacterised protein [Bordetella pertussis]|nr:Uncharacterised protein [Bordetella pertussis]